MSQRARTLRSKEELEREAKADRGTRFPIRFTAIWMALVALLIIGGIIVPRSLLPSTFLAIIPLAAFLAITAAGEAVVLIVRGIDLSIPATMTLSSTVLLGVSHGADADMVQAIIAALLLSAVVGMVNGFLVSVLRLNALIVTLAVGAITSGFTLWYRDSLPQESHVPPGLAEMGDTRFLGINMSVWLAAILIGVLTVVLRGTTFGRRFLAVGASPRAAWISGINVSAYKIAAFTVAGMLYGVAGILVSAFIRNPTLRVGEPYLLAPIAAAVLGGTSIGGGIGSMVAVGGAALFLTQLEQMLKMMGSSSAVQFIIEGVAIALGMAMVKVNAGHLKLLLRSLGLKGV